MARRYRAERSQLRVGPAPFHVYDFQTGMIARDEEGKLVYQATLAEAKRWADEHEPSAEVEETFTPGRYARLVDARSYFSGGFETRVAEPAELARQLEAHADEHGYVTDAIYELAAYGRFTAQARRRSSAASTKAGETILELVWNAGGELDYGKLWLELTCRVKGGVRRKRVLDQLERDGLVRVDVPRWDNKVDKVTVRLVDVEARAEA